MNSQNGLPFPLPSETLEFIYSLEVNNNNKNDFLTRPASQPIIEPLPSRFFETWLSHNVPKEFDSIYFSIPELNKGYHQALQRLQSNSNNQIDLHSIKTTILSPGIRTPDLYEAIDIAVNKKLIQFDLKDKNQSSTKKKKTKNDSEIKYKFNRFPFKIPLFQFSNDIWWSEENLQKIFKKYCKLSTLSLVYELNNTRHYRNSFSYNFSIHPHKESEQKLVHLQAQNLKPLTLVHPESAIITCSFYHPIRGHKMAEFDVLNTQTLADLRDSFVCDEDYSFDGYKYKGSVFYIDGQLYSDTRDSFSLDYSQPLGEFLINNAPEKLKSAFSIPQHKVTFDELKLPIGGKCSFLHQGDCEHRVTFTSIRRFDAKYDSIYQESYPLKVFNPSIKLKSCEFCKLHPSSQLVFNAYILPKNPISLCDSCCKMIMRQDCDSIFQSDIFMIPYVEIF